jgi:threonine dehydratase
MQPADVTLESIQAARARIAGRTRRTPVLENEALNAQAGAQLYFKCENFQEGGAFKARGATNAVFALSAAQLQAGVVTHSSGNHGAALARAARLRGVRARIVMPENSSRAKLEAVRSYGGEVRGVYPSL